jgi:hypothetical protein
MRNEFVLLPVRWTHIQFRETAGIGETNCPRLKSEPKREVKVNLDSISAPPQS